MTLHTGHRLNQIGNKWSLSHKPSKSTVSTLTTAQLLQSFTMAE